MIGRERQIRRVLIIVLALNVGVALAKLIVGALTRSISMQADGLHSLIDGSSNLVGLAGVWLAGRPADENHPYGHRKYETLASIAIGGLLVYTAVEIVRDAIEHIANGGQPVAGVESFAIMLVTIAINIAVTLWEGRQGRVLGSDVLLADATQTRSDIFASLGVILSLVAARLGYPQVDSLVALGVAVLVGRAAWSVLSRAAAVLSDEAALPAGEVDAIARTVPGVEGTHRVWTRGHESEVYIDLDIQVDSSLTVEQGHQLAHTVRERIRERWPAVRHIMVHVEPVDPAGATTVQRVHHLARQRRLQVHDVRARATGFGREEVDLHLEVDPALTLEAAHALAEAFEASIRTDQPQVRRVTTHIESAGAASEPREEITGSQPGLRAEVERVASAAASGGNCHAVRLYRHGEGDTATYDVILHCTLPASLSTAEAHVRTEQVERALRTALPALAAVTVHAEPSE